MKKISRQPIQWMEKKKLFPLHYPLSTIHFPLLFFLMLVVGHAAHAQQTGGADNEVIQKTVLARLDDYFARYEADEIKLVGVKTDSLKIDYQQKRISVYSARLGTQPLRQRNVAALYDSVKQLLPGPVKFFETRIYAGPYLIDSLIPNYNYNNRFKDRLFTDKEYQGKPWVKNTSKPYEVRSGLANRHLSVAQSHGKYWDNKKEWRWQRPRLFTTTEDLFTQSIVLPFLIPMLENAGAVVFTPRERDTQRLEVVVDNDGNLQGSGLNSTYQEVSSGDARWSKSQLAGFAQRQATYTAGQNPFTKGSARYIATDRRGTASAEWTPDIPQEGDYAVYVSYQTLPNSIDNAHYEVIHEGMVTQFEVNQQMGGGTWVYLGTFHFDQGKSDDNKVILTNKSNQQGVVTADAVRFGGGMGNISRGGQLSGLPRYLEGSRYWGQWAGLPDSVYTEKGRNNDYADDINSRSWIQNYLSGGSLFNPEQEGLRVPIEMSLAVHSDAGLNREDTIIGTLAIATSEFNDGLLGSGKSRLASRDLADMLQTQLVTDLRMTLGVEWTRRYIWDRNYSETRVPQAASTIIETMSHQNFGDLIYGHDPNVKFTIARALYKGVLRYIGNQHGKRDVVVQPLPVEGFAVRFGQEENTLQLSWQGVEDPLEPSASPREYVVYTRIGNGAFDNGVRISEPAYTLRIEPDMIYSFKVTALNDGGESFPSEVLCAMKSSQEQHRVLIINGFNRLSGPAQVNTAATAGFDLRQDPGVSWGYNIALGGIQQNFDRKSRGENWGKSGDELEGYRYAGNTFDFPYVHGKAIKAAAVYSFASCSAKAFEDQRMNPGGFDVIDLLPGLEKDDPTAHPRTGAYKTFRPKMRQILTAYLSGGGNLLVSGAYIGSDMTGDDERAFTRDWLKYTYPLSYRPEAERFEARGLGRTLRIPTWLNTEQYPVVSADVIEAVQPAFSAITYAQNNFSAAVAYGGTDYRTFSMGFPFEAIDNEAEHAAVMGGILQFLTSNR